MEQILYTSHAARGTSAADVFDIIAVSARNNPQRGVTGFLIYAGSEFLQLVEGEAADLQQLLEVLETDSRHADIVVALREPITRRRFADWKMQRFDVLGGDIAEVLAALREKGTSRSALVEVEQFLVRQRKVA